MGLGQIMPMNGHVGYSQEESPKLRVFRLSVIQASQNCVHAAHAHGTVITAKTGNRNLALSRSMSLALEKGRTQVRKLSKEAKARAPGTAADSKLFAVNTT